MDICRTLSNVYLGTRFNQFVTDTIHECSLQQNVDWLKTCRNRRIAQIASQIFAYLLTLTVIVALGRVMVPRQWLSANVYTKKLLYEHLPILLFGGGLLFLPLQLWLKGKADKIYQDFIKLTLAHLGNVPEAWNILQRYGMDISHLDLAEEEDKNLNLTDDKLEQLVTRLPVLTNIKIHADQLSVDGFTKIQQGCPELEWLQLEGKCFLGDKEYDVFEQFKHLTELSIQDAVYLSSHGFKSICRLFQYALRSLKITSDLLDRSAIQVLCQVPNLHLDKLQLYSSALEPQDFLPLIQTAKRIRDSISFKCNDRQHEHIPALLNALERYHHRSDGEWLRSYNGSIATLYFEEYSDSDSDSDDD